MTQIPMNITDPKTGHVYTVRNEVEVLALCWHLGLLRAA